MYIILLIALLPPFVILYYFIKSDKFIEPTGLIIKTFFLGILICIPAGEINYYLIWLPESQTGADLSFLAGFTEESLKFLALYLFIRNKADFNEPMDAIVYGILISLGFAAFENVDYVMSGSTEVESIFIGILRALTAIPMHASCGILMGYYFGIHSFKRDRLSLVKSLLIPMFFHAFYNYLAGISWLLMLVLLYFLISFALKMHRELFILQKVKNSEEEEKFL